MPAGRWAAPSTALVALVWGVGVLLGGDRLWVVLSTRPPSKAERATIRLLGIRYILEGTVQLALGDRAERAVVAVDSLHGASMLVLAIADAQRRRPALFSATVSAARVSSLLRRPA